MLHILRRLAPGLSIALCAVAASGCATITRGSSQAFTVESSPAGATVSLSNGERCTTPCTLKLKRKHPLAVEVCKAGYAPVVTNVLSAIKGAGAAGMAGNVLVGGLIGVGVDSATGATKDLTPNPLSVTLASGDPGCALPTFPAVPDGGQTPAEYAAQQKKKGRDVTATAAATQAPSAQPVGVQGAPRASATTAAAGASLAPTDVVQQPEPPQQDAAPADAAPPAPAEPAVDAFAAPEIV